MGPHKKLPRSIIFSIWTGLNRVGAQANRNHRNRPKVKTLAFLRFRQGPATMLCRSAAPGREAYLIQPKRRDDPWCWLHSTACGSKASANSRTPASPSAFRLSLNTCPHSRKSRNCWLIRPGLVIKNFPLVARIRALLAVVYMEPHGGPAVARGPQGFPCDPQKRQKKHSFMICVIFTL